MNHHHLAIRVFALSLCAAALVACPKGDGSSTSASASPCPNVAKQADEVAKSGVCQAKQGTDQQACMTTVFAAKTAGEGTDDKMCEAMLGELAKIK